MLSKILGWFKNHDKTIDVSKSKMFGHVVIQDAETKEVIRDVYNAINYENMSQALALSLAIGPMGTSFIWYLETGGPWYLQSVQ